MVRYIGKRFLMMVPVLIGVIFLIFTIMEMTPGDAAIRILGKDAGPEALEALREQIGLNKPYISRFFDYMWKIVTKLDFGDSWRTGNPVFQDISPRIAISVKNAFYSLFFGVIIGLPLGVYSAVKQYSITDNVLRVTATVLVAVPTFWFAMLLLLAFALYLRWLPSGGVTSWTSYILPMITCGGPLACSVLRYTRSTMLEEIRQDYVRTARAKGIPEREVTYKHALRNALLPVVTIIGSQFGAVLGGSVITESVFSMPGIGSLIILSIKSKDTPVVVAGVLMMAFLYAFIMLGVDLIYAYIDPRIKAKYTKG